MLCSSCGAVNPSGSRFCMSCGSSMETTPEPAPVSEPVSAPSPEPEPLEPVELGSVEPSQPAPDPVDIAPADLGSVDPVAADPLLTPSTDEPDSWRVEDSPPSYEPPAAAAEPDHQSWGPSVSDPEPTPAASTWSPPETSAPAAAPEPVPSWQAPAPAAAAPAWSTPAPAPAAPAPAPAPAPMPAPPNPSPGDPFALGAAAQRLDQSAQAAARTALVATAAVMVQGERTEAVTVGRLDGAAAVVTLPDRRLMAVKQRDWSPLVTWFTLDQTLDVQAWEDQTGATIVLSAAGRQVTLDTITDKQPAYELVARIRARLGR
jgi:zinc-ribbon domain